MNGFWIAIMSAGVASPPQFTEVTESWGLPSSHAPDASRFTTGAALFDWDGDGMLDLVIASGEAPVRLYRNRTAAGGGFEDVTAAAALPDLRGAHRGVLAMDFTGDGITDLFLPMDALAESPVNSRLWVGQSDGTFVDESELRLSIPSSIYFASAYGDPDADGDIDLALARWSYFGSPSDEASCLEPHFISNEDGLLQWEPGALDGATGCGLALAFTDPDDDGDLDLFVVNDYGPWFSGNELLVNAGLSNEGDVEFGEVDAASFGLDAPVYGMGVATADVDGDLRLDYVVTSIGEDALLLATPEGRFRDATHDFDAGSALGSGGRRFKWGPAFLDADNDGDRDLAVMASRFDVAFAASADAEQSVFLEHLGLAPFGDASVSSGLATTSDDRVVLPADLDRDGRIDVVTVGPNRLRVFRNVTESVGHFVTLTLRGTVSNRHGIGARVTVTACGVSQLQELTGGGQPGAASVLELHFGLGTCAEAPVAAVRWPSGRSESTSIPLDAHSELVESDWLRLSRTRAPADGATAVTVEVDLPESLNTTDVRLTTIPTTGPPQRMTRDGDTWVGTLASSVIQGELVVAIEVDGQRLAANPRVHFDGPQTTTWALRPAIPHRGQRFRVGLTVGNGPPTFDIVSDDAQVTNVSFVSPGRALATIEPNDGAAEVTLRATSEGAPMGTPITCSLPSRVDPSRSRVSVQRLAPGVGPFTNGVRFLVAPRDHAGWTSSKPDTEELTIELYRDGSPITTNVLRKSNHSIDLLQYGLWLPPEDAVGEWHVVVDGVPLDERARISGSVATAAEVSGQQSTFRFVDRHLHADGEDIVPLILVLRDDVGQPASRLEELDVGFESSGCEVLEESIRPYKMRDAYGYLMNARVGDRAGAVSVRLTIGGVATDVVASSTATEPPAVFPLIAKTRVSFHAEDTMEELTVAAVAPSTRVVAIIEVNGSSNTAVGSGVGLDAEVAGGTVTEPEYLGFGRHRVYWTAPTSPCIGVLALSAASAVGTRAFLLPFADPGAEAPRERCAAPRNGVARPPPDAPVTAIPRQPSEEETAAFQQANGACTAASAATFPGVGALLLVTIILLHWMRPTCRSGRVDHDA